MRAGDNVGVVQRRQAAASAEANAVAQGRASYPARPEPVPFCRRCLHDFDCMPDGR